MTTKRIKVRGVRRRELDSETLAFIFWRLGKLSVQERREREAREKAKRSEVKS